MGTGIGGSGGGSGMGSGAGTGSGGGGGWGTGWFMVVVRSIVVRSMTVLSTCAFVLVSDALRPRRYART
ncbi:hypothetical protein GP2_030_00620 [Gordonia paraffinivorans NBRC 108238]|uniref:Uncharacterized protein n=1 Tax=Gordonia paraffinivorans NBRC 108238 TaxID=1223543 RepID=A0ABQ0INN6_9ACTN|nr:hypothetical protein GP2_030_00620 [Gordonia paraffinivorans NBRC 108238]